MTKEEAKETLSRINNFCEEVDYSLPDNEKTGYKMLPDILALHRYINDVAEVKHGKWEYVSQNMKACSLCKKAELWMNAAVYDFCPHCGADMRE